MTEPRTWLIRGARIAAADGSGPTDILLASGVIADIGTGPGRARRAVVEADGLMALPGLVDLHTHLREPGREDAETVETGTRAAALGGFTAVHAMANTEPGGRHRRASSSRSGGWAGRPGYCDVRPVGAVTVGLDGKRLAELGAMADSAARVRVFSDDGHCVADPLLMRRALEYVKAFDGVIAQHAQEPRLTEGAQLNEGEVAGRLGLTGWPAAAEEAVIARDCLLAAHVGSALHVCHVSTAGSVEIIRWAKSKGWQVTAEVTPHHLLLTDDLAEGYDTVFKVNPPLRTRADVDALLAPGRRHHRLRRHRPRTPPGRGQGDRMGRGGHRHDRAGDRPARRPAGHGHTGLLDWAGVADRMSVRPARIGRAAGHGQPVLQRARRTSRSMIRPRP